MAGAPSPDGTVFKSNTNSYEIVKHLGKGSFAHAYLVKDANGAMVVDKVMDLSAMSKKEVLDARNEIQVLMSLLHPHITQYYESFQIGSQLHIVMEYADGGDLYQRLKDQRKKKQFLSVDRIMFWFVQVLSALHYIHSLHILHRDLKTLNLFLSESEGSAVKVGDFGIATVVSGTMGVAQTIVGTPYYFSPELCRNERYNLKSDVWSLGCILYELCTLAHPYSGADVRGLIAAVLAGQYRPINSAYPEELKALVSALLTQDSAKRPNTQQILNMPFVKAHCERARAILGPHSVKITEFTMAASASKSIKPTAAVGSAAWSMTRSKQQVSLSASTLQQLATVEDDTTDPKPAGSETIQGQARRVGTDTMQGFMCDELGDDFDVNAAVVAVKYALQNDTSVEEAVRAGLCPSHL